MESARLRVPYTNGTIQKQHCKWKRENCYTGNGYGNDIFLKSPGSPKYPRAHFRFEGVHA